MAANTFISRTLVSQVLREIDPVGVEFRSQQRLRHRGRFTIKGPNWVWSADGHDKLSEFGFSIYGIIDAYSRFIINIHVGIDNNTSVAIQKHFLRAVRHYSFPKLLRSDKG